MIESAIILSAGQGKRLLPLTESRPKCLLPFHGRTVLEWQIAALAANGIRHVTVVTGFHADAIDATLARRPADGVDVETVYNPFYEVADNLGSCYIARAAMLQGPFMIVNGDTLFHPALLARAKEQATKAITVTVDRKDSYDDDDMKVACREGRLLTIGKHLTADVANAESIGMLFFSEEGGRLFADAVKTVLSTPAGLKRWYLSVIDALARDHIINVAEIEGLPWCEIDFPRDVEGANALTARLKNEMDAGGGIRLAI